MFSISLNLGLLILRVAVAAVMLHHGISKIVMIANGNAGTFLNPLGIGASTSIYLAAFAETACALLIAFGAFTRLSALILAVNMCVIIWYWYTQNHAWSSNMELATLYLIIFAALIFLGAGKYSLDYWLFGACPLNKAI